MGKIGRVLKNKNNSGHTIKLGQDRDKDGKLIGKNARELFPITLADGTKLNEGDVLFLKDPRVELEELAMRGYITEDVARERTAKIPAFVKYNVEVSSKAAATKAN